MSFKYSCFISYRGGKHQLIENIINDLFEKLSNELELYMEEDVSEVYLDRKRLKGGDFFNQELARALCRSVCLIAVFTPRYFSKEQTYCTQEYRAMEMLEEQRLNPLPPDRRRGLIIPIILRGEDQLPSAIKKKRTYYNFEEFRQADQGITRPRAYYEGIKDIAEYIAERYRASSNLNVELCGDCDTYEFPDKENAIKWLEEIIELPMEGMSDDGSP